MADLESRLAMFAVIFVLAMLALLGHAAFWIGLANRIHATGYARGFVKFLSTVCHLLLVVLPVAVVWTQWSTISKIFAGSFPGQEIARGWFYCVPFWVLGLLAFGAWLCRCFPTRPAAIQSDQTTIANVADSLNRQLAVGFPARLLSSLPGNQILQLAIEERQLALERLPAALDGFSIAHLSDLHFTGRIAIEFFQEVVRRTLALRADMIVITGDLIDEINYLAWMPSTLAKLSAPLGVYFLLGNHDLFTGHAPRIRQELTRAGLIDVGGRWSRLEIHGAEVIVAGNELPWFGPAADMEACPPRRDGNQLRILLSHSPDQFNWARRRDFDLMLAGHTHGGQIRPPVLGPIVCPSWYGVKYASGTFYARPTVMHVSRGISSEKPLRLNCRPELGRIVLQTRPKSQPAQGLQQAATPSGSGIQNLA